jgi:hypothetical protein
MSDAPIDSLTRVVEDRPDDLPPWPHLAGPLPGAGRSGRAIGAAVRAAVPSAGREVRDTREGEFPGAVPCRAATATLDKHVPR